MNAPYEIFNNENGKMLDRLYGSMNAHGRAQGFANQLGVVVGCGSRPGDVMFFYPAVSRLWIPAEKEVAE